MFWKKSKDKPSTDQQNKTTTTTTIYRTDGGATTSGNAIASYESKVKSSSNGSSSKTKVTITSKQTVTQNLNYSEVTKFRTQLGGSTNSTSSISDLNELRKNIFQRQKTEPSIVRRLDAEPFSTKYESPYRKGNLITLKSPALPLPSAQTTTKTTTSTYQSPYANRNAFPNSSLRQINTLVTPAFQTKAPIWNPMSSTENSKPSYSWTNISHLPPKTTNLNTTSGLTSQTIGLKAPTVKPPPTPPQTVYAVNQSNRKKNQTPGVVYIFHNDKFDSSDKEFRIGSVEDVRQLKKTFKDFKMQVNLHENLTVKEVNNVVRKIEIKDFGKASCLVVVILTHGTRYETVAAKDGSYSIDDNVLFPILRNRSLHSKPKLFFIQACKGGMETGKFHTDAMQPNGVPAEILKCYSTFEGYVAYRTERGSLFIQSLCELLEAHGKTKNIKDIMDMIIKTVKDKSQSKQIPSYETTLTEPYILGDYL